MGGGDAESVDGVTSEEEEKSMGEENSVQDWEFDCSLDDTFCMVDLPPELLHLKGDLNGDSGIQGCGVEGRIVEEEAEFYGVKRVDDLKVDDVVEKSENDEFSEEKKDLGGVGVGKEGEDVDVEDQATDDDDVDDDDDVEVDEDEDGFVVDDDKMEDDEGDEEKFDDDSEEVYDDDDDDDDDSEETYDSEDEEQVEESDSDADHDEEEEEQEDERVYGLLDGEEEEEEEVEAEAEEEDDEVEDEEEEGIEGVQCEETNEGDRVDVKMIKSQRGGMFRKASKTYNTLLKSYSHTEYFDTLKMLKGKITRYKPGDWISAGCGIAGYEHDIPAVTTLLVVGPGGSGKTRLINNILRLFSRGYYVAEDSCALKNPGGDGTFFLQEYHVPTKSPTFCIYDTRSLSEDLDENLECVKSWMRKGVQHGEPVMRKSDVSKTKEAIKCRGRHEGHKWTTRRTVNFVIFVVNGVSVMQALETGDKEYFDNLRENFNCPYLAFRDDRPVLVVTHGDLLKVADRVRVRMQLGEVLGISPIEHVYDIPDKWNRNTKLSILGMLLYSLKHAERNLPLRKKRPSLNFSMILLGLCFFWVCFFFVLAFLSAFSRLMLDDQVPEWERIRHLWYSG